METKPSWKQKIDPAFDQVIKAYLFMLEDTEMFRNSGWLALKDEYVKRWEEKGAKGWYIEYEKQIKEIDELSSKLSRICIPKRMDKKELSRLRGNLKKEIFTKLKGLPAESQRYYQEKFKPFYSENPVDRLSPNMSKEDWVQVFSEYNTNYASLDAHNMAVEVLKADEPSDKEILQMFKFMFFCMYNTISIVVSGKYIFNLIREAKKGNQQSFLQALQIDRSILESNWAIKMIRKAQISGDEDFFKKMAKAITKQPFSHDKEFTRAMVVIILFWHLGLNKLTNSERIELLEACGIRVQDDPEVFRRFVNRLIKADSSKKQLTLF